MAWHSIVNLCWIGRADRVCKVVTKDQRKSSEGASPIVACLSMGSGGNRQ